MQIGLSPRSKNTAIWVDAVLPTIRIPSGAIRYSSFNSIWFLFYGSTNGEPYATKIRIQYWANSLQTIGHTAHRSRLATMSINYMKLIIANWPVIGNVELISETAVGIFYVLIFATTEFTVIESNNHFSQPERTKDSLHWINTSVQNSS